MRTPIDLTVHVRYRGPKARNFYPGSYVGVNILRKDLIELKLPHPKVENIMMTQLPDGRAQCTFTWPNIAPNCLLHRQLRIHIRGHDDDEERWALLEELSMDQLELSGDQIESGSPSVKQPAYSHKQWHRSTGESGLRDEAQLLLDDMASTLQLPKNEPVEPSLSDSPHHRTVIQPPQPHAGLYFKNRICDSPMDYESSMSISSSREATPAKKPPAISSQGSFTLVSIPDSETTPPGLTISSHGKNSVDFVHHANLERVPAPARTSRKRSHSPDLWIQQPSQPPPASEARRQLQTQNSNRTEELKRNLCEVRKQTADYLAREKVILKELRALGFTESLETSQDHHESVADMRNRLREIEEELEREKRLRRETEAVLADVQRECKAPFVVPAMFAAFRMISEITTQVMEKPA